MKVGIIGVPLETVVIGDFDFCKEAFMPGQTDYTRAAIRKALSGRDITIDDLGELELGIPTELRADRMESVSLGNYDKIHQRSFPLLLSGRERVLALSKQYDVLVALGHSHQGGLVLYDHNDTVVRMDYHSDFTNAIPLENLCVNYASYMNWVAANVPSARVFNYCVAERAEGMHGEERTMDEPAPAANHFDIDIDCFDPSYGMQKLYNHRLGPSGFEPHDALVLLENATTTQPIKLGIWEYRPMYDGMGISRHGFNFVCDAIERVVRRKEQAIAA